MALPLDGVRVVDLTLNIAGPYGTMILADLGADVLKIERPGVGDDARRMAPVAGASSAYFAAINRNKRSVVLDLDGDEDRTRLEELLGDADVFATNLLPGKLARRGLGFEELRERFPRLIYADVGGYGDGPEQDRPGYDMVLQARSGLMSVTGEPGRSPVRVGVSILDMGAGIWLALGVLAALRLRDTTGVGTRVATSLLEVGAAYMAYDLAAYAITGAVPVPRGSGHPAFAPYGAFRASDGWVALGVGADHLFARLAEAVGRPEWVGDERYATNAERVAHREALRGELEAALAELPVAEWVARLRSAGVPVDRVADVAALLEDEQLDAVRVWLDVPADGRTLRQPGLPVRVGRERSGVRRPPPGLGEHTGEGFEEGGAS
jgi:crotonobetainyl-CoA:carnitine CoA-transferase CaiB-like acyl-CoA transferase